MRNGDSASSRSSVTPQGFPEYPAYAGRYKILDLMKLQFSKIAKNARREFSGLMARPKIEFHEEWRFHPGKTNRQFRREWFNNHKGRFIASEHKRHFVLTSRPGPGPLTKSAIYLRKEADRTAKAAARLERSNLAKKGTEGPPRPARVSEVLRDSVRTTSKTSSSQPAYLPPQKRPAPRDVVIPAQRAHIDRVEDGYIFFVTPGGKTRYSRLVDYEFDMPPPKELWAKYKYFYRTRGRWRVSKHHPIGNEESVITDWLSRVSPG
jgi:hypothetical protein